MGGGDEIKLSHDLAVRLKNTPFPVGRMSLQRKAEKIIAEWLDDREDTKAADASARKSAGKPNVSAADLYRQCGL